MQGKDDIFEASCNAYESGTSKGSISSGRGLPGDHNEWDKILLS